MTPPSASPLPVWKKAVYGSGQFGLAAFGMLRQIFYAIFLTDVIGLDPRLASLGALVGIIWDAINDPLVGAISDRVRSRWGRRRPFLLLFAIPFGLSFVILWWAPPWRNQWALTAWVTLAFMLSDTFGTLIAVPYTAMTPEISRDYDERTSLASYRMFFQLAASLTTAIVAPTIVNTALAAGMTQQQGYLIVASMFGGFSILPLFLIAIFIRINNGEKSVEEPIALIAVMRAAWANIPFRFAVTLNMLNWVAADLVAMMVPYFLLYWIAHGNLMASVTILGINLSLQATVLGLLLLTATLAIPFWAYIAHRFSKRSSYLVGIIPWAVAYIVLAFIQPGQINLMLLISGLAGIGLATGYVLPEAIFPDVIEWDELLTRRRQEGIFYGIKNFVRKISSAIAFFLALQILGWSGYQAPPKGVLEFMQPPGALTAIRLMAGPSGLILLFGAAITAWFYPMTREKHSRIRRLLEKRSRHISETK